MDITKRIWLLLVGLLCLPFNVLGSAIVDLVGPAATNSNFWLLFTCRIGSCPVCNLYLCHNTYVFHLILLSLETLPHNRRMLKKIKLQLTIGPISGLPRRLLDRLHLSWTQPLDWLSLSGSTIMSLRICSMFTVRAGIPLSAWNGSSLPVIGRGEPRIYIFWAATCRRSSVVRLTLFPGDTCGRQRRHWSCLGRNVQKSATVRCCRRLIYLQSSSLSNFGGKKWKRNSALLSQNLFVFVVCCCLWCVFIIHMLCRPII